MIWASLKWLKLNGFVFIGRRDLKREFSRFPAVFATPGHNIAEALSGPILSAEEMRTLGEMLVQTEASPVNCGYSFQYI